MKISSRSLAVGLPIVFLLGCSSSQIYCRIIPTKDYYALSDTIRVYNDFVVHLEQYVEENESVPDFKSIKPKINPSHWENRRALDRLHEGKIFTETFPGKTGDPVIFRLFFKHSENCISYCKYKIKSGWGINVGWRNSSTLVGWSCSVLSKENFHHGVIQFHSLSVD